ncbi:MAG TPA: gluconate 2-dehydrogenase subunit 3 family protein [Roseimicrobium sp.]|nr:gluconate 2-dehydrogenase subunit 3 family protein [Roseimicrobium sp.]
MSKNTFQRMDRREALKWVVAATATVAFLDHQAFGAPASPAGGYGTDPNLMKSYKPGELWPRTLTDKQLAAATGLCDVIIPADTKSPSASKVGVPDFIDEWVSAPYDQQVLDRPVIIEGLGWIDEESQKRFKKVFADLSEAEQVQICDDICYPPNAKPEFKKAATFFSKFRNLTLGGFYTTRDGWRDIQYVGNLPVFGPFKGPPPAVLQKLGLA